MMKFIVFTGLFSFHILTGLAQAKQTIWTEKERQSLINGLQSTMNGVLKEVEGLTEKQLHYKIDSTQWSVAEVLEHLGTYEELLYWDLLNNQYTPERPDLVKAVQGVDSAMVAYATDPAKGQAPFAAQPLGRFQRKEQLITYFTRFRSEVVKLIQNTKEDYRLHFIYRPKDWGVWHLRDLHQYTLLWIAHTQRHTNQILRVKASAGFPSP